MNTLIKQMMKSIASSSQIQRLYISSIGPTKLIYAEHGVPSKVVQKENDNIIEPTQNEVLLRMLASPVNPVDINVIEGKYISRPNLPSVAGSEGVGEILSVGAGVSNLKEGDRAVLLKMNLGAWRTHLTLSKNDVLKVPNELNLVQAATLTINPCTAYRLLKDFADLSPGDTLIQNGSNSACGQNVIQLARTWGITTVNIIRNRPNVGDLKDFLTDLGATYVLTEEELKSTDLFKSGEVAPAKLAFDCVGGKSVSGLLKNLVSGGRMVVYGGMSREPISIPTPSLIFKDHQICGMRINKWMEKNMGNDQWHKMFDELISLMVNKELQGPAHEFVDLKNYKTALENTITERGMIGKKFILTFSN